MALPKSIKRQLTAAQLATLEKTISRGRSQLRTVKSELSEYRQMLEPAGNLIRKGVGFATGAAMQELDERMGSFSFLGREVPASFAAGGVAIGAAALTGDKTIDDVAQSAAGAMGYQANGLRNMMAESSSSSSSTSDAA